MAPPVPWSDLPIDILIDIFRPLDMPDLLCVSSVCSSFRSVAKLSKPAPYRPPWLMFYPSSHKTDDKNNENVAKFYNLSENRIYKIPLEKPFSSTWQVLDSSHGWLIIADEKSDLQMFNPLTREHIPLPPVTTMDGINPVRDDEGTIIWYETNFFGKKDAERMQREFTKVVLSCDPNEGNYYVVLIHSPRDQLEFPTRGRISFMREGDERWTLLDEELFYDDIVFRDGLMYGVTEKGGVHVWDLTKNPSPLVEVIVREEDDEDDYEMENLMTNKHIMVTPWGDILVVCERSLGTVKGNDTHAEIKIYKVEFSQEKLVEIDDLGDHAIFLGKVAGCFSTRNCLNLRSKMIYYPKHYCDLRSDHSGDHILECEKFDSDLRPSNANYVWISPNFCKRKK